MNKILLLTFCVSATLSAQTVFFVSPSSKSNSGDGSYRRPFATIEQAQMAARKAEPPVTVYLRGGDYRLNSPLRFTAEDCSLKICAYRNERAVIKGSVELKNLKWNDFRDGIKKAKLEGLTVMDMLLVNGALRPQARYPNYDSTAVRFNGTSADATSAERVKGWNNPVGGYLHAMHAHDWGDFHYRITGKDSNGELTLEGGHQNNRRYGLHRANRMVENILEELDVPGEWYYDAETATLYYYPFADEDVNKLCFESPQLKSLIDVHGSEAEPVRDIIIEGIDLTQTVRTFMEEYEPLLRSDWTIYRGGAVFVEGAENLIIKNCNLFNVGGNGLFFSKYNRDCEISGSHLYNIGASAICFVGSPEAVRSPSFEYSESVKSTDMDRAEGPRTNNYPAFCRVHDNLIHHIGLYEKQITGVELSMCRAITISHNTIYDTPRAGVNISEGTWGGHILEYNDVFNTVKETGDHGSFNSWGRDRYWLPDTKLVDSLVSNAGYAPLILADAIETTVIRNNRFRCDRGWDIDLDDGSTNYHIYNNLCLNGGLKLREGFYRIVENNILINNSLHRHVWFNNNGNVFARNIVMLPYPAPVGEVLYGAEIDSNVFPDSLCLQTARQYGTDASSIVANIRFVNAAEGDFRIDSHCTDVFSIGFQNFAMDRFGVVSARLKALADKPLITVPVTLTKSNEEATISWESVQIKNLVTLGERSATGMDAERGVYVVTVGAYGSDLRDYLKSNDVILGFDGKPVNNLDELRKCVATADLTKPVQIKVFRNQREMNITIAAGVIRSTLPDS